MPEVNLMDRYPRTKRPITERGQRVTEADREISRQFGKDYFDGDRMHGYGGFNYHPRFWTDTVKRFRDHYQLPDNARILDVGCAKGFTLHDFKLLLPNSTVAGIDISEYAIANAIETMKPYLRVGNAKSLPFPDKSFDLVLGINVVHNLPVEECKQAVREIQRVSKGNAFLQVDAYRSEEEKKKLIQWVLTCRTHMYTHEWEKLFQECGYTGDYCWFIAE